MLNKQFVDCFHVSRLAQLGERLTAGGKHLFGEFELLRGDQQLPKLIADKPDAIGDTEF